VVKSKAVKSHTVYGGLYRARNYAAFYNKTTKNTHFLVEVTKTRT